MAIVVVISVLILASSVGAAVFSRRAGYTWGPYIQSPFVVLRQAGPARKIGTVIALFGFLAYVVVLWRGSGFLPQIVLGLDFVLIGIVNVIEPVMPNTRLNLRWIGLGFVLLGLAYLTLGVVRAASGAHRPLLVLIVEIPAIAGVLVAFALSYARAFHDVPH